MDAGWWGERARGGDPGRPSPRFVRLFLRTLAPLLRVAHRPRLEGTAHLPARGPYMLVANHSGVIALSELCCFAACWLERFGEGRPLAGMAHPIAFHIWPFRVFVRGMGAIPSTHPAARRALAAGVPLLAFPGGDHEAGRPVWQARRVDLAGRRGFLRIAREAGLPIVPMGIRGSHCSAPVLHRSRLLPWLAAVPRLFGVKRFPLTALHVLGFAAIAPLAAPALGWGWTLLLCWLWLASPLPLLPWIPTTIRMRIGEPIPPQELFARREEHSGDEEASLARAYARVEGAIQALVLEGEAPIMREPARGQAQERSP